MLELYEFAMVEHCPSKLA